MKRFHIIPILLGLSLQLGAQNLNPTVVVTNALDKDFSGASKKDIPMAVPDTLMLFDRNFDYSVFEKSFKGSYEFVPFSVKILPQPGSYGAQNFWMCAGAGYTLHPVLNLVYSPKAKDRRFNFNLFQRGNGYWGEYRNGLGTGYDFSEELGAEFNYNAAKCTLSGEIAYDGIFTGVTNKTDLNGARLSFRVKSVDKMVKDCLYDVNFSYVFGNITGLTYYNDVENDFRLNGSVGPKWGKSWSLPIDYDFRYNHLVGLDLSITPHVEMNFGVVEFKGGIRLALVPYNTNDGIHNRGLEPRIYPDVYAKWDVAKKYFTLYASAVGGESLQTMTSLHHRSHFSMTRFAMMDNCNMDFKFGMRGAAGSVFQWDLRAGYGFWDAMTLDALTQENLPGFASIGCKMAHADARIILTTTPFDAEISAHWRKISEYSTPQAFLLPELSGDCRLTYNWMKRFYIGVWAEGALERKGPVSNLPAYVDLGATAEYRYNRKLSFWLQGANLLDQEILRTPVYAEKGINFTAGVCLNF